MRNYYLRFSILFLHLLFVPLVTLQASQNFTKNNGQLIGTDSQPRPEVKYYTNSKGAAVFLREDAISYVFTSRASPSNSQVNGVYQSFDTASTKAYRIDMEFVDAHIGNPIIETNQQTNYSNYYLSHCQNGITNVPDFETITYESIYDGIDLVCYHVNNDFKYDFVVHPGADPGQIKMRFVGGEISVLDDGSLLIASDYGELLQAAPTTFEKDRNGNNHFINNYYVINSNGELVFNIDKYDPNNTLIIDPLVQNWSTYINPSNAKDITCGLSIDHDPHNNIYSLIYTNSQIAFPISAGLLTYSNKNDYAILKRNVSTSNNNYSWITYFGGSQNECIVGIDRDLFSRLKVDHANNVVISGTTGSIDLPTKGIQQSALGIQFIAKFDKDGILQWSTYFGDNTPLTTNTMSPYISGLAINNNNEIAVSGIYVGNAVSGLIKDPGGAYIQQQKVGSEAFVCKFSSNGLWQWGTLYGGSGDEEMFSAGSGGVVFAPNGDLIIGGTTSSSDLPGKESSVIAGGFDVFVARFDGVRLTLKSSSYYGGSLREVFIDLTIDNKGNLFVAGTTTSSNLPRTSQTFQPTLNGGQDFFVVKLIPDICKKFVTDWATYYGGIGSYDYPTSIKSGNDRLYLTGVTQNSDFPVTTYQFDTPTFNVDNLFAVALQPNTGQRFWGLCYGGLNQDWGADLTIVGNELYIIGLSRSPNLQTTGQSPFVGYANALLFNLSDVPDLQVNLTANVSPYICEAGFTNATLSATLISNTSGPYHYYLNGNYHSSTSSTSQAFVVNQPGKYTVTAVNNNGTFSAADAFEFSFGPKPELTAAITHIPSCITEVIGTITNYINGHTYEVCVEQNGSKNCFTTKLQTFDLNISSPGTYNVSITDNDACLICPRVIQVIVGPQQMVNILGQSGSITTITGSQSFNGNYLVEGPLEFTSGTFTLEPGTRFFIISEKGLSPHVMGVYPFNSYASNNGGQSYPLMIKVGDGATLKLKGATITPVCGNKEKWAGIHITHGARIITEAAVKPTDPSILLKSLISEARIGIGSSQLTSGSGTTNVNFYNLSGTIFKNNLYGFRDYMKGNVVSGEGIQSCLFQENEVSVFFEDDIRVGQSFGGNYVNGSYRENKFENNKVGVKGAANNILLTANEFRGNADLAVDMHVDLAGNQTRRINLHNNLINIPDNAIGIRANNGQNITENIIEGANAGNLTTGISINGTEIIDIHAKNTLRNLGIGIYAGNPSYGALTIINNWFENNVTSIYFPVFAATTSPPTIKCNTFSAPIYYGTSIVSRGIFVGPGARLTYQNSPNILGSIGSPNGNYFHSIHEPVRNNGVEVMTYYSYNTPQEKFANTIPSAFLPLANGGDVDGSSTKSPFAACGGTSADPGVFTRQGNQRIAIDGDPVLSDNLDNGVLTKVYPNPNQGLSKISYNLSDNPIEGAIIIRNLITQQIIKRFILNPNESKGTIDLDLSKEINGVYSYSLILDGRIVETKKLIILR